ncbi:phage regulatory protein [Clostridium botulinum]|uniref:Rha family transcriptional regulator n=1 Tax=Clostridium botulinum TaxID=1491 RepID=UPI00196A0952|nr:Rha family transcriptional regulator [Clostridium botulinum]MBN3437823.1 phage regulatory protein [Clostridium botulinum]QDY27217.1 phage regulatory protein [Clostridium botulinum]
MNKSLEIFKKEFGLENTEKGVLVSSRIIANKFNKEHKDILEKIRNLVAENSAVKNMVIESSYKNRGKKYKEYLLTRDGFSLLVMGFTGKKALDWKLKYIEAFNKMEEYIKKTNELVQSNQTMFLAQNMQNMASTMAQFMETSAIQMQQIKQETKEEVSEIVRDSIIIKDEQINQTAEMIGMRNKQVKVCTEALKDKLYDLYGYYIPATSEIYKRAKRKVFKHHKVCVWEDVPISRFGQVQSYIDSLEREDLQKFY